MALNRSKDFVPITLDLAKKLGKTHGKMMPSSLAMTLGSNDRSPSR